MEELKSLKAALSHSPENIPLRMMLVRRYAEIEDYQLVEELCREGLKFTPQSVDLLFALTQNYLHTGRPTVALPVCDKLLSLVPDNTEYLHVYAKLLVKSGKREQATETYRRIQTLDPEYRSTNVEIDEGIILPKI